MVKLLRRANGNVPVSAFSQALAPHARTAWEVELRRAKLGTDVLGNRIPDKQDPWLVDPNGPLADLLVAMGRRDIADRWAVGDTPKGIKR